MLIVFSILYVFATCLLSVSCIYLSFIFFPLRLTFVDTKHTNTSSLYGTFSQKQGVLGSLMTRLTYQRMFKDSFLSFSYYIIIM